MWRLMYALIVVSDTGSIAVDSSHSDWPSQVSCEYAATTLYAIPPSATIHGVKVTMKSNVQCVPVNYLPPTPMPAGVRPPPPLPNVPGILFGPGAIFGPPQY
jgi:hypothetical protein